MKIPVYLALPAAEFLTRLYLPPNPAWMACHFSPSSKALSNIPDRLPPGTLLILNDSFPYQDHDIDLILSQLTDAITALHPDALLLDFQRPHVDAVQALTKHIVKKLPCPVIVSSLYAADFDCPIFLSPEPLWQSLADYLKPYQNREIWLDVAPIYAQIRVSRNGSIYTPTSWDISMIHPHYDDFLHCHYHIKIEKEEVVFSLCRSCADLSLWLAEAEALGIKGAVGLFQELGNFPLDETGHNVIITAESKEED